MHQAKLLKPPFPLPLAGEGEGEGNFHMQRFWLLSRHRGARVGGAPSLLIPFQRLLAVVRYAPSLLASLPKMGERN
jgi:hypothetical protein